MQTIHILLLILIMTISRCSQQNQPQIQLTYINQSSASVEWVQLSIFYNNTLNSTFTTSTNKFSCANLDIFTYNQTQSQYLAKQTYNMTFTNFNGNFTVLFSTYYNVIHPTPSLTHCDKNCIIQIDNNCTQQTDTDIIQVQVISGYSPYYIKFIYNVICDKDKLSNPIEWGKFILIAVSTIAIFIASKFQQVKSYYNYGHYINYISITIYCTIVFLCAIIVIFGNSTAIISDGCLLLAMLFGVFGVMVCCAQFLYFIRVRWLRWGVPIVRGKASIRVLDVIGLVMGVGLMCGWYFSGTNWIIGDFICLCIFCATIKLIKFGSLKIAIITFVTCTIIDIIFIVLSQTINGIYFNNAMLTLFNNPLFLVSPDISHYPNRRCSWIFLFSMAYPGIFLCYLQRFDTNRSSHVYLIIFLICYTVCYLLFILISINTLFTLPYDIMIIPISLIFILLFANRRGELTQLWTGKFYDQSHYKYHNQQQLQVYKQNQRQRTQSPSQLTYTGSLFNGLRYVQGEGDQSFRTSQLNNNSNNNRSRQNTQRITLIQMVNNNNNNSNLNNNNNIYSINNSTIRQSLNQSAKSSKV